MKCSLKEHLIIDIHYEGLVMDKYEKQLNEAIRYALQMDSFNKTNIVERAENVCVFGLGTYFREAFLQQDVRTKYHVNLICDNNDQKVEEVLKDKKFEGLKSITVEELRKLNNLVVIIMLGDPREVEKQLGALGIGNIITFNDLSMDAFMHLPKEKKWFENCQDHIIEAYHSLTDNESRRTFVNLICNRIAPSLSRYSYEELYTAGEYFNSGVYKLTDDEYYIDCGAFDGDTVDKFILETKQNFGNIYAFELDSNNYNKIIQRIDHYEGKLKTKIDCYNYGVWDEEKVIQYGRGAEHDPSAGISIYKSDNTVSGKVVRLDDILKDKRVTFCKMDIEGAEQNALKGARNIIMEQKPKLAICIYHKLDDFWEIPLYLKKLVPEYHICIRHHYYYNCWGTVCYAYI